MAKKVEAKTNASQGMAFSAVMGVAAQRPKTLERVYMDAETGLYSIAAAHDGRIGMVLPQALIDALDSAIKAEYPDARGRGQRTKVVEDLLIRYLIEKGWEV